ncbi:MAG: SPOR domain-containing protein [Hyphomicrobiaceae bacterium]
MARSTTSTQQFGSAQQAANPGAEVDAYGRPLDPNQRWAAQQARVPQQPAAYPADPHAGYAHPGQPAYQGHAQPAPAYQGQPVADPAAYYPQQDYPTAPPHPQGQAYPGQPYAQPGSDPYAQHQQGHQPAGYERYAPPAPAPAYDRFDTQLHVDPQSQAAQQAAYDQRAYQQAAAAPAGYAGHYPQPHEAPAHDPNAHYGHAGQPADPRHWDLSQYPPPGGHPAPAPQLGYPPVEPQHAAHADPRWAQANAQTWAPPGQGYTHAQPAHYAEPAYDPVAHQHQPHQAGVQHGYGDPTQAGQAHGYDQADPNAAFDEEEAEAPRRPRAILVVGALIGAIALGGGLAYGYKKFVTTAGTATTPIVKADNRPTRTKPADPGGKEVPHTDKKVFSGRLEDKGGATQAPAAAPPAAAPTAPVDAEAPRKVQTVIVNRDGTLTPSAPPAAVPGLVIEGVPPPAARPELRGPAPQERQAAPPVTPVQKAPAQPKVAELPLPKVKPETKAETPAAAAPVPVKKKAAPRDDLVAQQQGVGGPTAATPTSAAPATAAKAPGANGYVTVLTSRKSREDALKSYADLHQKYGEVLGNRPTDVREVNLGEKGIWFRSIVGPPGSREAANSLCKQLKDQGYKDCFPMAY